MDRKRTATDLDQNLPLAPAAADPARGMTKAELLRHLSSRAPGEFGGFLEKHMEKKGWPKITFNVRGEWIGLPRPDDEAVIAMISEMILTPEPAPSPEKKQKAPAVALKELQNVAAAVFTKWLPRFKRPSLGNVKLPWAPSAELPSFDSTSISLDSLLLAGLPISEDALKQNKIFAEIKPGRDIKCVILSGVPGTGKTRANYELLSRRFGLYFIANTVRGIGSDNLSAALHDICVACGPPKSAANELDSAEPYWRMLFLSHLLIHEELKNFGIELSAYEWLLLQLYPRRFTAGIDIFNELYCHLREKFEEKVISMQSLTSALEELIPKDRDLYCVVDEAQELLIAPTNSLQLNVSLKRPAESSSSLLTLFGGFMKSLPRVRYVVSGTSPELHWVYVKDRLDAMAEITEIQTFRDEDTMKEEVMKYFTKAQADWIITNRVEPILRGRARILMSFLLSLITSLREKSDPLLDRVLMRRAVQKVIDRLVKEWETRLEFILRRWDGDAETCKTMMFETVANYAYLGGSLVLYDDTARLMDHGILKLGYANPLKKGGVMSKYGGTLEEPIVLQALMNISLRRFNPYKVFLAEDTRNKGYTFESACIAMLLGLMKDKQPGQYLSSLEKTFYLDAGPLPLMTKDYDKWAAKNGGTAQGQYEKYWKTIKSQTASPHDYYKLPFRIHMPFPTGKPLVTPSSNKRTIKEFFKDPETVFYTPGTFYGPDLAFILEFLPPKPPVGARPPTFFVPAFLQAKFEAESGNDAENIEKAILKSEPMIVSKRDPALAGEVKLRIKNLRALLEDNETKFKYEETGSIRFIFRASQATQKLVPRAFIDEIDGKRVPRSLVIYLEKDSLLKCFPDPDLENALKAKVPW